MPLCKGCRKDAASLQRKSSAHSLLPLTLEEERDDVWDTHCCDPLLQWLENLRRAHTFFSVDYPCFTSDGLQILSLL